MHTLDERSAPAVSRPGQLSDRASEFRIVLSARQEADAILADAGEVRLDAGLQAELLVAEAESLSRDLVDQAMSVLDRATEEARERAEGILAVARASAEDVRRRARADVVTDREAFQAEMDAVRREEASAGRRAGDDDALDDIENTIRSLGAALELARGSMTDAEETIGLLRTEMAGTRSDTSARAPERSVGRTIDLASATRATRPGSEHPFASERGVRSRPAPASEVTTAPAVNEQAEERTELRPLGWLFRSDRS